MLRRLPLALFLVGLALKAILVIAWRLSQAPVVLRAITAADPVAFKVAEWLTPLFFSQRRIMPTIAESVAFEVFLVLAFAVECLVVGFIIRGLVNRYRRQMGSVLK